MGAIKKVLSKEEKIRKEIKRLEKILVNMPEKPKNAAKSLINNAAFMHASIEELQEAINEKGYVEEYSNGANQKGFKKRNEVEIYNTMIKNYAAIMKQLTDLIPAADTIPTPTKDAFQKIAER